MSGRKTSRKGSKPARRKWLLPLLGMVAAGILVLLVAEPFSRPTDPSPDREEAWTREAEEIVAAVLEAHPLDPDSHALMGTLRYVHGQTREAEKFWERGLELDPQRVDIYETMAKAAWENGEFAKAAAAYRHALRIDPTLRGVHLRLGRSLLELGQIEEAVAVLEQAVSSTDAGHYYLAQAYMQARAYEKARDSYLRAVDLNPDNAEAYYGLALASIRLGQPEKASHYQEEFRKYRVEDPDAVKAGKRDPQQLSGLGRDRTTIVTACTRAADIYRRHGELQRAERLWQRAAVIDPGDAASRQALLALYEQTGRLEDARTFFAQLTQTQPANVMDHFQLGLLCVRLNRRDEAEQAFLNVTRHAPDRPEGYEALVQLYLTTAWKLPAAKAVAARAVELRPSPQNYFLLAQVCARIGDRAEALTAVEQALRMDPESVPYQRLHGELKRAG